jgi:hypothetical protein
MEREISLLYFFLSVFLNTQSFKSMQMSVSNELLSNTIKFTCDPALQNAEKKDKLEDVSFARENIKNTEESIPPMLVSEIENKKSDEERNLLFLNLDKVRIDFDRLG